MVYGTGFCISKYKDERKYLSWGTFFLKKYLLFLLLITKLFIKYRQLLSNQISYIINVYRIYFSDIIIIILYIIYQFITALFL